LLRRSAAVELTIGLAVVILTAILVGTSPPDADDGMPSMQSSATPFGITAPLAQAWEPNARTSLLAR